MDNPVYLVAQRESDGRRDVEYYNRYFVQYTQPLLGWRDALQSLQELTYYDFELDVPVMDRYGIDVRSVSGLEGE